MPVSVTIPLDAANGTVLTAWVNTAATTNYYNCTVTGPAASGMGFEPLSSPRP